MATKTISITENAYERLKVRKEANESFSGVINRITGKRSLMEFAGMLSEGEGQAMMQSIREGRERSRKRRERQLREMGDDTGNNVSD